MRRFGQREDRIDRIAMVVEENDRCRCPIGAPMHARGKRRKEPSGVLIGRESRMFLLAPGEMLLVEPNQHRRVARKAAERIEEADLVVALGPDRQIDADHARHLVLHRPGGEHDMRRRERPTLVLMLDVNPANPPANDVDADDPAFHDLHVAGAGLPASPFRVAAR